MAISFVGSSALTSGVVASFSVPAPSGVVSGDYQLIFIGIGTSGETITSVPSGWTLVGSLANTGTNSFITYVYSSTTDTGSAAFTRSGTRGCHVLRVAYRGVASASSGSLTTTTTSATTHTVATQNVSAVGQRVVGLCHTDGTAGMSFTPPSGWTERYDFTPGADESEGLALADYEPGSTGNVNGTFTLSTTATATTFGIVLTPVSNAPAFVGSSSVIGEGTTINVPAPSGVQAGDFQLIVIANALDTSTEIDTVPSGWTQMLDESNAGGSNSFRTWLFASTTDTTTAEFTQTATGRGFHAARLVWRGHNNGNGSSYSVNNSGPGTMHAIQTTNVTVPDSLVVAGVHTDGTAGTTFTPPSGWTERHDAIGSIDYEALTVADYVATSTGNVNATFGSSQVEYANTFAFILTPASSPTASVGTISGSTSMALPSLQDGLTNRTNIFTNPSVEVELTGWTNGSWLFGTGTAVSRYSLIGAYAGGYVCRVQCNAGQAIIGVGENFSTNVGVMWPTVSTAYTVVFHTMAEVNARAVYARLEHMDNGEPVDSTGWVSVGTNSTSGWTRHVIQTTTPAASAYSQYDSPGIVLYVRFDNCVQDEIQYVDAVLCEKNGTTSSAYFDGDTPDTSRVAYSWLGSNGAGRTLSQAIVIGGVSLVNPATISRTVSIPTPQSLTPGTVARSVVIGPHTVAAGGMTFTAAPGTISRTAAVGGPFVSDSLFARISHVGTTALRDAPGVATIEAPTGTQVGDRQFLFVGTATSSDVVSLESDLWTLLIYRADNSANSSAFSVYTTDADIGDVTLTREQGSRACHVVRTTYRGVGELTQEQMFVDAGIDNIHEAPDQFIASGNTNAVVVGAVYTDRAASFTAPAGWNERYDDAGTSVDEPQSITIADVIAPSIGLPTSVPADFTSNSPGRAIAFSVTMKAATAPSVMAQPSTISRRVTLFVPRSISGGGVTSAAAAPVTIAGTVTIGSPGIPVTINVGSGTGTLSNLSASIGALTVQLTPFLFPGTVLGTVSITAPNVVEDASATAGPATIYGWIANPNSATVTVVIVPAQPSTIARTVAFGVHTVKLGAGTVGPVTISRTVVVGVQAIIAGLSSTVAAATVSTDPVVFGYVGIEQWANYPGADIVTRMPLANILNKEALADIKTSVLILASIMNGVSKAEATGNRATTSDIKSNPQYANVLVLEEVF